MGFTVFWLREYKTTSIIKGFFIQNKIVDLALEVLPMRKSSSVKLESTSTEGLLLFTRLHLRLLVKLLLRFFLIIRGIILISVLFS